MIEDLKKKINADYDKKVERFKGFSDAAKTWREKSKAVQKIAKQTGLTTSQVLLQNLADAYPDGVIPEVDLKALIVSTLKHNYEHVSPIAAEAQATLNKELGVGLKPVVPEFDVSTASRVAADAAKYETILDDGNLKKQIVNSSMEILDRSMEANAKVHENAGFEVRVVRVYDGIGLHNRKSVCEWCMERAGAWTYDEARANGVFARHEGCECEIYYETNRQNWEYSKGWGNQWRNATESEIKKIRGRKG